MTSAAAARPGVVLDAGVFIAVERRVPSVVRLVDRFIAHRTPLVTSAGVVAQVWRGGASAQAGVAILLRRTDVVDLTRAVARVLGLVLGESGTSDPIDAHVVFLARERGWPVVSSDASDLLRLDPALAVERI